MAERQVVVALLLQAIKDAESDNPAVAAEARRWLSGGGRMWAEMLDISADRVRSWVDRLDALPYEQLPLFDW